MTEEKLARIDTFLNEAKQRLDRLVIEARRPRLPGPSGEGVTRLSPSTRRGFDTMCARARPPASSGSKPRPCRPDRGYLVPPTIEREVLRPLALISPNRAVASVRVISGGLYKRAYSVTGAAAEWVGETAARRGDCHEASLYDQLALDRERVHKRC